MNHAFAAQFLHTNNVAVLWEVVSDTPVFTFLSPDLQAKVYEQFRANIGAFVLDSSSSGHDLSLVQLNKKYIMNTMQYIQRTFPQSVPDKLEIGEPLGPGKELVTFEEIHADQSAQFARALAKRREEFEDTMHAKPPAAPMFADPGGAHESPIRNMDALLKDMVDRRNYDVLHLHPAGGPPPPLPATGAATEATQGATETRDRRPGKSVTFQQLDVSASVPSSLDNMFAKLKLKPRELDDLAVDPSKVDPSKVTLNEVAANLDAVALLQQQLNAKLDAVHALLLSFVAAKTAL